MAVFDYISEFHKQNFNQNKRDYNLCKRYTTFSQHFAITVIIFYVFAVQIYQSPKYYAYLTSGAIQPSMSVYVPFVEDLDGGLVLIQIYNIILGVILSSVPGTFDAVVYLVSGNITIIPTIIKREMDDLKTILQKPNRSLWEIRIKMREIISMHRIYNQ